MTPQPSPTGPIGSGRDAQGRFAPGNRAAKGNPLARKAQSLRSAMFDAVSAADLRAVVKKLLELAKAGDVQAARLVFERCLGPVMPVDVLERLEALETLLQEDGNEGH